MTFYELEKMCKKRMAKKRIIYIFFIILLLIIVSGVWVLYKNTKKTKPAKKIKTVINKIKKPVKAKKEQHILKNNKNIQHSEEMVLTPIISLNFTEINTSKKKSPKEKNVSVKKVDNSLVKKTPLKTGVITTEILPSYDECIYQAQDALKNKNYALALKWAQNANIKNKLRPEAWIISAEILYKTGKKQKALNILKLYLKYHKNKKIEKFLKELENEK